MAKYLVVATYTAEGAKGVLKDGGSKRRQAAEAVLKSVGGKVTISWASLSDERTVQTNGPKKKSESSATPR